MSSEASESGFTLIELVVVIVIIGLLSAAALPRFIDLTEEAEEAGYNGVKNSVSSGVSLARSKWLAKGLSSSGGTTMKMGGADVAMNESGWPKASRNGVLNTLTQDPSQNSNWTFDDTGTVATLEFGPTASTISYDPNDGRITAD